MTEMNTAQVMYVSYISEEETVRQVALEQPQVQAMFEQNNKMRKEIEDLKKKIENAESNRKYYNDQYYESRKEIDQTHTLLTALGVVEKPEKEYAQQHPLPIRLALYIANNK